MPNQWDQQLAAVLLNMFDVSCTEFNTFRVNESTPCVDTLCVQYTNMKTIGERIRQARLGKGWSAHDLATRVGYKTQSGISNLENSATGSGGNKIAVIATKLSVSLDWLLNGPDTDTVPYLPDHSATVLEAREPSVMYLPQRDDQLKADLLGLWGQLNDDHKREWLGDLRRFVREKGPHSVGADPAVAKK
jgi:transcriptional regulator with XRE-family HTH domain